jgi:hypothetical protein
MIYAGYKFEINQAGLFMLDTDPREVIKIDKLPLNEGDVFILVRGEHGEPLFIKHKQLTKAMDKGHDEGL